MQESGYIQVYTGNGKGKTTAAMGLALRAYSAGLRVYFGQFMKSGQQSDARALSVLTGITHAQYGSGDELVRPDAARDRAGAQAGFVKALDALQAGDYDVVVLDEIHVALHLGHLDETQVHMLMRAKPPKTELVLTGRWARKSVMDAADLVTQMLEEKHYFSASVPARRGIEC